MWQPSTPAPPPRERAEMVDASTTTFLRSIPAFQGFGENQLKRIRAALRRRAYAAHEILIEQGAAIGRDAFFVLASGRVRVFVDGRQVAVLSAGDYVGERALVLREPRASTCVADAEGCACLVLDAEAFEDAVLARGSEDLSPSKRTRRRSSWVRSFNAYEHDARDEGAARLGAFAADYAALLSETSGDGDFSSALNGDVLPPAIAAELRLLLLEALMPELSADDAVDRIIGLAERVFPGTVVVVRDPVAGESHRVVAADSTLAAPVTSRGRLLAILELRGGSIPPSWPAAAAIFAEALAAPLASSKTTRRDSVHADDPPPPPPPPPGSTASSPRTCSTCLQGQRSGSSGPRARRSSTGRARCPRSCSPSTGA